MLQQCNECGWRGFLAALFSDHAQKPPLRSSGHGHARPVERNKFPPLEHGLDLPHEKPVLRDECDCGSVFDSLAYRQRHCGGFKLGRRRFDQRHVFDGIRNSLKTRPFKHPTIRNWRRTESERNQFVPGRVGRSGRSPKLDIGMIKFHFLQKLLHSVLRMILAGIGFAQIRPCFGRQVEIVARQHDCALGQIRDGFHEQAGRASRSGRTCDDDGVGGRVAFPFLRHPLYDKTSPRLDVRY